MADHTIDRLLAEHELQDLLARFDDAAISNDSDAFRSLWTADAVWEIGEPIPMKALGRDAIVAALSSLQGQNLFFFRLTARPVITITGDEARLRSPTVELAGRAGQLAYANVAFYEDTAVREDGAWKFRHRSYRYLWVDTESHLGGEAVRSLQGVHPPSLGDGERKPMAH